MPRRLLAVVTACALVFAACSGDDDPGLATEDDRPLIDCDASFDHITVSGPAGTKPTVEFEAPLEAGDTGCQVLQEGEGDAAEIGDLLVTGWMLVNGRTGEEYLSRYEPGDEQREGFLLTGSLPRGIRQGMVGAQGGSRTLTVIAPEDGFQLRGGDPAAGLEPDDPLVMVADVTEVRHPRATAEGEPVTPATGQPTVTVEPSGKPTIAMPGDTAAPTELVVQPLIEGDGDVVETGDRLLAHYTLAIYETGEEFDTTWDSPDPTVLPPLGSEGVIQAWSKGLVGQPIGSRVLLIAPPAEAYGPEGFASAGISGTDTLVFVIDILEAW